MAYNAQTPIVDAAGTMTVPFNQYLQKVENGDIVCLAADLGQPLHQPAVGARRFLSDTKRPVWGDGSIWVYADGTPV